MRKRVNLEFKNEPHMDGYDVFSVKRYVTNGYFAHFHTALELYGVLNDGGGEVTCCVSDGEVKLRSGQFICVSPLTMHSYRMDSPAEIVVATVGRKYLRDFNEAHGNQPLKVFLADGSFNKRIVGKIMRLKKRKGLLTELEKRGEADLLLNEIAVRYGFQLSEEKTQSVSTESEQETACRLLRYLYENYAEKITLSTLAQTFNMAPMVLSRLISRVFGEDLRNIVSNIRVQMYYEMRRDSANKAISNLALAYRCGFNNQRTFESAYERTFGRELREDDAIKTTKKKRK